MQTIHTSHIALLLGVLGLFGVQGQAQALNCKSLVWPWS